MSSMSENKKQLSVVSQDLMRSSAICLHVHSSEMHFHYT